MKNFKIIFILVLSSLSVNSVNAQFDEKPNGLTGCWEQCFAPITYDTIRIFLPIYSGNNEEIENKYTKDTTIVFMPRRYELVQDELDPLRYNRAIKEEESIIVNWYLTDTTITSDFYIEQIVHTKKKFNGMKWYEIICEDQLTNNFTQLIQFKLMEAGYLPEMNEPNSEIGNLVKSRFEKYQTDNGLPSGCFNIITFKSLGIIDNDR